MVSAARGQPGSPANPGIVDGLSRLIPLLPLPQRIVSLVPSLTEALFALGLGARVAGRTEYCIAPAGLVDATPAMGGTKTPDLDAIQAAGPDLVIASAEENVREHVEALIRSGLRVYVSLAATVERAIEELADLVLITTGSAEMPDWLADTRAALDEVRQRMAGRAPRRYFCPIWRRPYMVAAPDTYMSDLLRMCGGVNIFNAGAARYYAVELADVAAHNPEVVLLPDEPYPFAEKHLLEIRAALAETAAVRSGNVHLIDGQWVTWYGPRMGAAIRSVAALFEEATGG